MHRIVHLALSALLCLAAPATASDTTVTYQGELRQAGSAASGSYDMEFRLWDKVKGGIPVGPLVEMLGVAVENGLFTVVLDFGAEPFDGEDRWLEISVGEAGDPTRFTLDPRQPISRSPYSIQTRGIYVDDTGRVGIGTTSPQSNLAIEDAEASLELYTTDTSSATSSRLSLKTATVAQGIHTTLGGVDFTGEDDSVWGSLWGSQAAEVSGSMSLRAYPSTVAQLDVQTGGVRISGDLQVREQGGLLNQSALLSGGGSDSYLQALGGDLGIGTTTPWARLDVLADGGVPAIRANGSADATLGGGGLVLIGDTAATNIVADQNEIMARNNGAASTLYLNAEGAPVRIGSHGIRPAIAYAKIAADGSIISGVNVHVAPFSLDKYRLLDGDILPTDIIVATVEADVNWKIGVIDFRIDEYGWVHFDSGAIGNDSHGRIEWDPQNVPFNFVVYRP